MKAFLMHPGANFDPKAPRPGNADDLVQDLELETLIQGMAGDDAYLADIARSALLQASETNMETVLFRQAVLKDCFRNTGTVKSIYAIAIESLGAEKKNSWSYFNNYPAGILRHSLEVLNTLVELLSRLRHIADKNAADFESGGFRELFATLQHDMDDDYFARVLDHLQQLKFDSGVLVGAQIGHGNKGRDYRLLRSKEPPLNWFERLFAPRPPGLSFTLHPRDEGGMRALSELSDRGIDQVADAVARSTDHIVSFFVMLRNELAFYMGCLGLRDRLQARKAESCIPAPSASDSRRSSYQGLYDPCLALRMTSLPVANDGAFNEVDLVFITGANQGGKSTFLRSMGIAQLMMQAGMFVAARAFEAPLCEGLLTHYKREEDTGMRSGKFDEELVRMSSLLDQTHPNAFFLFNESFAATNEREGSEIAAQIVKGLLARKVRVMFVTHMFELAHAFFGDESVHSFFLRAERDEGGGRSFRLGKGEPLRTSFGRDLYEKTFASDRSVSADRRAAAREQTGDAA